MQQKRSVSWIMSMLSPVRILDARDPEVEDFYHDKPVQCPQLVALMPIIAPKAASFA